MGKATDNKVKQFIARLRKQFHIEMAIFFGSRAHGNPRRNSDYDFILVSKDFQGIKFTDRISKIYPYWTHSQSIEPLCYTPREFNKLKKQISIVREAVRGGKEV